MIWISDLTAATIGAAVSICAASTFWFVEVIQNRIKWTVMDMLWLVPISGLLGAVAAALARLAGYWHWANALSGALGVSIAFGLAFIVKCRSGADRP